MFILTLPLVWDYTSQEFLTLFLHLITSTFVWRISEIRVFLALCHTGSEILINNSTGLKYMSLRPSFCLARNNARTVGRIFIKLTADNIYQNFPL